MKKQYESPTLTVHGSVQEITQFFGNSTTVKDFLFFAGTNTQVNSNNANTFGSVDGELTITGPNAGKITPKK
ncbi:hypothetical protein NIES2101_40595 [Calothrix sp. HK-06]|nr:hypothetical protein NIES2101_40595 [Calothrix sp. HK-06]